MSDEESQIVHTEDGQMLTAEYRDGQLQIVEVTEYDKGNETHILSDLTPGDDEETRYVQVLDGNKGILHLDLLSLIKCSSEDGDATYQVVGTSSNDEGDTTVTCVLANDDHEGEENENQDSYVVLNTEEGKEPLVYLQSTLQQIHTQQSLRNNDKKKKTLTNEEILAKAKALQNAKALAELTPRFNRSGRKRKSDLPPPLELLSSPGFKFYLYSCKMCNFKCNAMRDMSKHKAKEHGSGRGRGAGGPRAPASLQCARCPYRASVHSQLIKHVSEKHLNEEKGDTAADTSGELVLDEGSDGGGVEVLVCGACGFESDSRAVFRKHVESAHSLTLTDDLTATVTLQEETSSPSN